MKGSGRLGAVLVALTMVVSACGSSRAETTTTTTTTTTAAPQLATTLPLTPPDGIDRIDQLKAIGVALNINRLIAIQELDTAALRALDGTDTLFSHDRQLVNNGGLQFLAAPTTDDIFYEVTEVLVDRTDCAIVATLIDLRTVLGFHSIEAQTEVIFFDADGTPTLADILPNDVSLETALQICDTAPRTGA